MEKPVKSRGGGLIKPKVVYGIIEFDDPYIVRIEKDNDMVPIGNVYTPNEICDLIENNLLILKVIYDKDGLYSKSKVICYHVSNNNRHIGVYYCIHHDITSACTLL